ncbi:Cupin RmlC-type [Botryosphaeria dothidea]|uniref:Cupin RmlC-type n=1 Tax=Botryosphaeria dothidea TaxID=55169 RepID=A0A8H4J2U3_9PEZI|nr:Cupin RmlC-type [Botryosphaeria dothidea]
MSSPSATTTNHCLDHNNTCSSTPHINTPAQPDPSSYVNEHNNHDYFPDEHIPGNPHMLKIASHTAYRSAARSPSSILARKASWINTTRNISLSPNGSRPTSKENSPIGTPVGTPRSRSPVRGFASTSAGMGKQDGVENKPPRHEMTVFENLLSEQRRFGVFRKVLHTGLYSQLVAMEIPPNGDIGEEVHSVDQTLLFTHGTGLAQVGGKERPVKSGDVVIVPAGTQHQFLNTGKDPLELITVYAPAEHDPRTVHQTKEEGDKEEEDGIDIAPEWSRRSQKENEKAGLVKTEGGPYDE